MQPLETIKKIAAQGGPKTEQYSKLTEAFNCLWQETRDDAETFINAKVSLQELMLHTLTVDSMHGLAYCKPRGYAGDFEIIQRIYDRFVSEKPHIMKWDKYFQAQSAAKAVRNRLDYFLKSIIKYAVITARPITVLSLGCGPCCEVAYALERAGDLIERIVCVDFDEHALNHATSILSSHMGKIELLKKNVLRLDLNYRFDLIWSSGLFDYFSDRIFRRLLKKLSNSLSGDGGIIVGNFGENNETRGYMELVMEWILNYRSHHQLIEIANSIFPLGSAEVESESEGLNLFLNVRHRGSKTC